MADSLSAYDQVFEDAGRAWNVDPLLLRSIAKQESGGRANAVSKAGAQGLMQIIPETQRYLGVTDPNDPVQSIFAGAKYLSEGLDKEGNPAGALLYYHGGPDWRNKYGPESAAYVPAVSAHYQALAAGRTPPAPPPSAPKPPEVAPETPQAGETKMADETPDEFLKRTTGRGSGNGGNTTKDTGQETPEQFLARTAPKAGEAKTAETAAPPGPYSEYGDLSAQPWAQGKPVAEGTVAPIVRGVEGAGSGFLQGATQGWQTTQPYLTPYAENQLAATGPISRQITIPLVHLADIAHGGVNALIQGATGAIGAGTEAAGIPRVGQDINALAAVAPMAGIGTGVPRVVPDVTPPPSPRFSSEIPVAPAPPRPPGMSDMGRINQLIAHDTAEMTGKEPPPPPPPEIPATTAGVAEGEPHRAWVGDTVGQIESLVKENAAAGGPQDLSAAATPQELAAMSPQMAKAYRRMAEVNRVVTPIEGEDTSIKVPGSIPTEAEAKGDPVTSQKEVMTRQRRPEAFEGPQGRLTQNDAARTRLYDDQTLSDPQIETLNEDQAKQARKDTATVIAKAGPVNGAPVAAQLKGLLDDPRIKEQPDIVKVLQPIHDALYDADGNLKTDIQSYWGMHDNLMTKLAKAKDPLQASSSEKFAFNQLVDAKKAVDGAMDKASDGAFQNFLDNQAEFFKSKNAATILRDFRTKMVNPKTGTIDGNRFHRFVTDLAVRRGKPGIDPAMDIPDEVMSNLMDIDDDLKRAGRIDLGKPRGSPTNLYFELAKGLGIAGAHSLAAGLGPVGNIGVQVGVSALQRMSANMRLNKLVDQSLNYPPSADPRITPSPTPTGRFVPPIDRNPLQSP